MKKKHNIIKAKSISNNNMKNNNSPQNIINNVYNRKVLRTWAYTERDQEAKHQ